MSVTQMPKKKHTSLKYFMEKGVEEQSGEMTNKGSFVTIEK